MKFLLIISALLFSGLFLVTQNAYAFTEWDWNGGGATNNWSDTGNWECYTSDAGDPIVCPAPGYPDTLLGDPSNADLVFIFGPADVIIDVNVTLEPSSSVLMKNNVNAVNNAQLTFYGVGFDVSQFRVHDSNFINSSPFSIVNLGGDVTILNSEFTNNGFIINGDGDFSYNGAGFNTFKNLEMGFIQNDGTFDNALNKILHNFGSITTSGTFNNAGTIINDCFTEPPPSFAGSITSGNDPTDNCGSGNNPPTANDDLYSTNEDVTLTVPASGVLENDDDSDGDTLIAILVDDVSNGELNLNSDGSFTYIPNTDYNGDDTFTYQANDGTENSSIATVTITVNPVNDSPAFTSTAPTEVNEDESYSYSITSSDPDGDSLIITSNNPLPSWLVLIDAGDGSGSAILEGTPTWGDVGEHDISLQVTDDGASPLSATQEFTITVQGVVIPELQNNLNEKMIKQFEKKIHNWTKQIEKLNDRIDKLEERAAKADDKGKYEKADKLRVKADDIQDKIKILEDMVSVIKMSIGTLPIEPIPIELQEHLLPKSVDKTEHQIEKWMYKVAKLNHRADNLEEKAQHFLEKGKGEKAQKLLDEAAALRDKANVYEDLIKVLKTAIDFDMSSVKLPHKYDDKEDKEDEKDHSWSD